MNLRSFLLTIATACFCWQVSQCQHDGSDDLEATMHYVKKRMTLSHPTILNNSITFSFKLYSVLSLDDKSQTMRVKARLNYGWHDPRLSWNKTNQTTQMITLPIEDKFWRPDVSVQQSEEMPVHFTYSVIYLTRDGYVLHKNYYILHVGCPMSILDFPLDTQHCTITFHCTNCYEPYGGDANPDRAERYPEFRREDQLIAYRDLHAMKNAGLMENNIFSVINMSTGLHHDVVYVRMTMRRRSTYFFFYLITPGILLTSVAFIQYIVPAKSPAKLGIGMSTLVAITCLYIIVGSHLSPDVTGALPMAGRFFGVEILLIALMTAGSALVVSCQNRGECWDATAPPTALRYVLCWLAKIVCMCSAYRMLRPKQNTSRGRASPYCTRRNLNTHHCCLCSSNSSVNLTDVMYRAENGFSMPKSHSRHSQNEFDNKNAMSASAQSDDVRNSSAFVNMTGAGSSSRRKNSLDRCSDTRSAPAEDPYLLPTNRQRQALDRVAELERTVSLPLCYKIDKTIQLTAKPIVVDKQTIGNQWAAIADVLNRIFCISAMAFFVSMSVTMLKGPQHEYN